MTILDGDPAGDPPHPPYRPTGPCTGAVLPGTGASVYFVSRDGWISKFDLYSLKYLAEIRAGINSRNLAVVSADGHVFGGQ